MLKLKRALSFLLSVLILIGLFVFVPVTVGAYNNTPQYEYDDWGYSYVSGGGYCIDKYTGDDSDIIVPGVFVYGDGTKRYVYYIGDSVFRYSKDSTKIKTVDISDGITDIGANVFEDCIKLTEVKFPSTLTNLGKSSFTNCTSLKNIELPAGLKYIAAGLFTNCTKLENVILGNNLREIRSNAFYNCSSLRKITIPSKVSNITGTLIPINEGSGYIGSYVPDCAFKYCNNLEIIDVDENNTTYCSINGNVYSKDKTKLMFYATGKKDNCFTVPDTVKTIYYSAFDGCQNLEKINIPESVTGIKSCAFFNCKSLKKVMIPKSLKTIENSAFRYCTNITDVYYNGTKDEWKNISIYSYNSALTNATIHCLGDIPEEKRYTNSDGDIIGLNEKLTRASDDTVLSGIGSSFNNLDILGVQKKNDKEAKSVRFVSVLNNEIAKDADDYGYIVVGAKSMDTARSVVESYTLDKAPAKHVFSCKGSDNSVSGDYGKSSTDTKYKYVTFSINNIGDNSVAVMFYVKDKNGNVYYSPYTNSDGDTYNSCSVNWESISD